ncbi:MAG: cytochrome c family protein [Alphaproteobacteria bacterium]
MRFTWFAAAALTVALAACGQSSNTETTSSVATATQEKTEQEIATAVAALPAPYNTADYQAGRSAFAQCRACHALDGNRVGPNLHGLFGRTAGTEPDFSYSDAVKNAGFAWDADHLDHWLTNPREFLPGNRMAFIGIHDEAQRRNLIAYLMIETK